VHRCTSDLSLNELGDLISHHLCDFDRNIRVSADTGTRTGDVEIIVLANEVSWDADICIIAPSKFSITPPAFAGDVECGCHFFFVKDSKSINAPLPFGEDNPPDFEHIAWRRRSTDFDVCRTTRKS